MKTPVSSHEWKVGFKDQRLVLSGAEQDGGCCEILPTKDDIRQPRVDQLNIRLLPEINGDVPCIGLHLAEGESKFVVVVAKYRMIQQQFDVIVTDSVGEKLPSRQSEVLKEIEYVADLFGVGMWIGPTLSTLVGRITFQIAFHRSVLNFKLPSLSNSKSIVSVAQSSLKPLLVGSSPIALNQSPTERTNY